MRGGLPPTMVRFVPDPREPAFVNSRVRLLHPVTERVVLVVTPDQLRQRRSKAYRYHCRRHGWRLTRACAPCRRHRQQRRG